MGETDWKDERRQFEKRVETRETEPSMLCSNPDGTILLAVATLDAFEGNFEVSPYLKLVHCLGGAGRFRRAGDWGVVDGPFKPGMSAVALPSSVADGFTPKARLLGVGIDPQRVADALEDAGGVNALMPVAGELTDDSLVGSVLVALWRDAEVHGLSSAFFDHGLDLVLRRLAAHDRTAPVARSAGLLSQRQLRVAIELIDSRIGSDLRVEDLASVLGREKRSLTRAFRATTGYAPYEYLTFRRMERAKELLATGASIMEISLAVGYANPAKFAAAFRRFCGCTPSDWRRRLG